jgi:hypothetical protein
MPREANFDLSPYKFSDVERDSDGNAYLTDREPFTYQDRPDNITHHVEDGDTLQSLAQLYYWDLDFSAGDLWWVIADYQPNPIINPFAPLQPGKLMIIPAPEFVSSEILASPTEVLQ